MAKFSRIIQEVIAAETLEQGLDIIANKIASFFDIDVCSIYLKQPDTENFVLMATVGLNKEAVGRACLACDEGLVSLVAKRAEPINLQNAIDHPNFRYISGTGEENYKSFLGVPIIHSRKVVGVAVIQHSESRLFSEDDVASLMTITTQLADVIKYSEISSSIKSVRKGKKPLVFCMRGIPGGSGISIGTAVVAYVPAELETVPDKTCSDITKEIEDFSSAVKAVQSEIKSLSDQLSISLSGDESLVFEAYIGMLENSSIIDDTIAEIEKGKWAPTALRDTILAHVKVFEEMDDPYLRERAVDIRDLGRRILMFLQNESATKRKYPKDSILVGTEITPSQMAEIPRKKLAGIVSVKGSVTSHVSILAKAMGVPAVMGVSELPVNLVEGRRIIVDGYSGRCYLDPSRTVVREYNRLIKEEEEISSSLQELRDLPAESEDGQRIALYSNTGLISDINYSLESGAEGIGLHRTEFPFMTRDRFPGEREQTELYRSILEPVHPQPVVLRTLDIGGDKSLPYFPIHEDNPFLGWRGVRITLDHPEIFATQLRSMLKASAGLSNLQILIPMVSCLSEIDDSISLLERVRKELLAEGETVTCPKVGVMIEVPSSVYLCEAIARRVDFLSIGTNDLTQYLIAVDRNNSRVADLYDELHPAVLRAILHVADTSQRANKPLGVCGSMAGDPAAAILLFAMGVNSLSMSASSIPRIKWVIRSISKSRAEDLLDKALLMDNSAEIRSLLNNALEDMGLGSLIRAGK